MLKQLYDWMGQKVHSKYALSFLAFLFFIEAIFFVPVDPILALFCLEKRESSYFYAAIATTASIIGGITAYFIGLSLWNSVGPQIVNSQIVSYIVKPETFEYLCAQYNYYAHWAVLIFGFSPLPYKAATLTAGFCRISFAPFVLFSIIARGARFFMVAWVLKTWGPQIKKYIDRYFNLFVVLTIIVIGAAILIFT